MSLSLHRPVLLEGCLSHCKLQKGMDVSLRTYLFSHINWSHDSCHGCSFGTNDYYIYLLRPPLPWLTGMMGRQNRHPRHTPKATCWLVPPPGSPYGYLSAGVFERKSSPKKLTSLSSCLDTGLALLPRVGLG